MPIYSHSRISTYEQCPLKFKFGYIDEVKTEITESIEAFMGKRVHEALQKLYNDLKFLKLNTIQELLEFYNKEWNKNWNPGILIAREEYNEVNYKKMGEKYISDYYRRYYPFEQESTISTEQHILINLGDFKIQGYIDRLSCTNDGAYYIHDYKTSNNLPTQEKLENDRQLALYSIFVFENYQDCKEVNLIWHYLAFDREFIVKVDKKRITELKEEVIKSIKEIESALEFPPKINALCDWCEFQPMCPNFKHKFKTDKLEPDEFKNEDGVLLVNKYAEVSSEIERLTEEKERVKQRLVSFAKENDIGIVYGSDVRAVVRTYPTVNFPKKDSGDYKKFIDMLKTIGLWEQISVPDSFLLARKIKDGEIPDEIIKLLRPYMDQGEITKVYLNSK
ncbi:MAG: PD-(D/E)XK nuclease family protein [Candidatus Woesearchaeota archaeon]